MSENKETIFPLKVSEKVVNAFAEHTAMHRVLDSMVKVMVKMERESDPWKTAYKEHPEMVAYFKDTKREGSFVYNEVMQEIRIS